MYDSDFNALLISECFLTALISMTKTKTMIIIVKLLGLLDNNSNNLT